MQPAGAHDLLELLADDVDALADQPPVGLDLRLAGAAEEAEAAALALEMGPGPHQPALLVVEMGELDLQPPFPRPRALAEDLEDQPGAVEHLGVPRRLEVALLHRRQRMIDDDQPGLLGAHQRLRAPRPCRSRTASPAAGAARGTSPLATTSRSIARGEADRLLERACGDRSDASRTRRCAAPFPRVLSSTGASTTALTRPSATRGRRPAPRRAAFLRFSSFGSVGRNYSAAPSASVMSDELDRLTRHDGRYRVLVDELRMSVPAQQHAEIIEPGHDALQLHAVDEKDGQRRLVLANVVEKRVLKTLRAFCRHGLPRPFGHAYAVDGAGLLPCPA